MRVSSLPCHQGWSLLVSSSSSVVLVPEDPVPRAGRLPVSYLYCTNFVSKFFSFFLIPKSRYPVVSCPRCPWILFDCFAIVFCDSQFRFVHIVLRFWPCSLRSSRRVRKYSWCFILRGWSSPSCCAGILEGENREWCRWVPAPNR